MINFHKWIAKYLPIHLILGNQVCLAKILFILFFSHPELTLLCPKRCH